MTNVPVVFDFNASPAESGGRRVVRSLRDIRQEARRTHRGLDILDAEFEVVRNRTVNWGQALVVTGRALRGMAAASVVAGAAVVRGADVIRAYRNQLNSTLESTELTRNSFRGIADAAVRSHTELGTFVTSFQQLSIASENLGLSIVRRIRDTESLTRAFKLSGQSAQSSAGAIRQFLQGLQSGALRGQELNSVLEQAPLLAKAIAEQVGSGVGDLRRLAEEGALTIDVQLGALERLGTTVDQRFNSLELTASTAFQQSNIELGIFISHLDESLGLSQAVIKALVGWRNLLREINLTSEGGGFKSTAREIANSLGAGGIADFVLGTSPEQADRDKRLAGQRSTLTTSKNVGNLERFSTSSPTPSGAQLDALFGGAGRQELEVRRIKAQEREERAARRRAERAVTFTQLLEVEERRNNALERANNLSDREVELLRTSTQFSNRLKRDLRPAEIEQLGQIIDAREALNQSLERGQEAAVEFESAFESGLRTSTNLLKDFIRTGEADFEEFVAKLGDIAFDLASNLIISGITNQAGDTGAFQSLGSLFKGIGGGGGFQSEGSFTVAGPSGRDRPFVVGLDGGETVDIRRGRQNGNASSVVVNVINNSGEPVSARSQQSSDGKGRQQVDIFIEAAESRIAENIQRNQGPVHGAIGNAFRLEPGAT